MRQTPYLIIKILFICIYINTYNTFGKSILNTLNDVDSLVEIKNKHIKDSISYPFFLTKKYKFLNNNLVVENTNNIDKLYKLSKSNIIKKDNPFEGINTKGSISRGVNLGNNKNTVLNSELDLQLYGRLNEKVEISASIQDANIPVNENGYSQRLDEFDQIFIELKSENWKIRAGDIDINNSVSYFGNFTKKIQGLLVSSNLNKKNKAFISGAIVKGQFRSSNITALEGNQGPYKIRGNNGELYILVISGSEKVYVDGVLLTRGENKDYIMNYNAGEIIFNTTYPISSENRIRIDYQISDRNYSRFMSYAGNNYKSEKLDLNVMIYNEKDLKRQNLQQNLNNEQRIILNQAGDNISLMESSSAQISEYNENRILYKKINQNNNEYFEFSNNPSDQLYTVKFTYVGENKGNYILKSNDAISNIYEYINPIQNIKQGSYDPIVRLIAPEKLQMAVINGIYSIHKNSKLDFEIAGSIEDKNLFSSINDEDNQGIALKADLKNTIVNKKGFEINNKVSYKQIDKYFRSIEYYYDPEFIRNWNIDSLIVGNNSEFTKTQKQSKFEINIIKDKIGSIDYNYQNLNFSNFFKGSKNQMRINLNLNKLRFLSQSSNLKTSSQIIKSTFITTKNELKYSAKKYWTKLNYSYENNIKNNKLNDSLIITSHGNKNYGIEAGIGDLNNIFLEIGVNYKTNDSVNDNTLKNVNNSLNYLLRSRLVNNKNTKLTLFTNYKVLERINQLNKEKYLNSKLDLYFISNDNLIRFNTIYETNSGNHAQQEYTFIEVEPGLGNYKWIDINENNIQELEEFEIAQFEDEGIYIRVLLPNQKFIRTYQNKLSQTININFKKWSDSSRKIKNILSNFQNQIQYLIEKKSKSNNNIFDLNPLDLNTENLLGLNMNLKNSLYFNKGEQYFSTTYNFVKNKSKNTLSFGYVENDILSHQLNFNHKLNYILLSSLISFENKKSSSENFENKNYSFDNYSFEPKLSYFFNGSNKLEMSYQLKEIENIIGNNEKLNQNKFGVSTTISNKKNLSILGEINYFKNKFAGNANSVISYIMMEGLQKGKNITWSLNLQKNLTKYLDLNLNYFARKSELSKTIHNGNIQLKANF
ncbi:MAG: hypothetical protein L7S44_04335 [Flavobacteriaceae bacterium]|nr:hypothetical protein [Flavobacteriaceae bacterium]